MTLCKSDSLHVLAIDPFHGGSHREFLRSIADRSRHRWTLVTGKPVHWKWRMRSAPLELAAAAGEAIKTNGYPDVVFCSDMLDLAQWRGLIRDERVLRTPTVVYFHESQWTYPLSPEARVDHHFAYTNLVSALASDACWFNSQFHLDDFLGASESFVTRMPDSHSVHDLAKLRRRCRVIPPGFDSCGWPCERSPGKTTTGPLTLGWVSRWEHDKRPDLFLALLSQLGQQGIEFNLVLLGPRPRMEPESLAEIRHRFGPLILHDSYAATVAEYRKWLQRIDVVVSTADHEFFGIAVCEAIWAGAAPLLPNRLSYPELSPGECLYDSLEDAVAAVERLLNPAVRTQLAEAARERIKPLRRECTVAEIDEGLVETFENR